MKSIPVDWIKHLPQERQKDFESILRNSSLLFARLNEITTEWERALDADDTTKPQYSSPAWAYLQAHKNGNREMIKKLKDLISFTQG